MKYIITAGLLALGMLVHAQKLRGVVVDANTQMPLVGASIQGEKESVITDQNGAFALDCTQKLKVDYPGYEPTNLSITSCDAPLNLQLVPLSNRLPEVMVSAQNNQNPLEPMAAVTLLQLPQLQQGNGLFLDDALNARVPGITMSRRGISSGQQFNIRGYGNGVGFRGANNNFDTQGTKVYLNGIPVTDAEGITVMDDLDFASLGKVVVTKGPSGATAGMAIAGVVEMQTARPDKNEVSNNILAGNYGLFRNTTSLSLVGDNYYALLNYGNQKSDGYMPHTASTKQFVNFLGQFAVGKKAQVDVYLGWSDSYDQRAGELTEDQFLTGDYSGNQSYIRNQAHSAYRGIRTGLAYSYRFDDRTDVQFMLFGSGAQKTSSSSGGWNDSSPINYGLRVLANKKLSLWSRDLILSLGGEAQEQRVQPVSYRMVEDSTNVGGDRVLGPIRSNLVTASRVAHLFLQGEYFLTGTTKVKAAVGIAGQEHEYKNRINTANAPAPAFEVSYGALLTPDVSIHQELGKNHSIYARYSEGYKAPVTSQLVVPFTGELNTGLVPEKGSQLEIGVRSSTFRGRLFAEIIAYRSAFTNKMTSIAVENPENPGTTLYTYLDNSGSQNHIGVEAMVRFQLLAEPSFGLTSLEPWVNVSVQNATYGTFFYNDVNYADFDVAGVTPLLANAGIDFAGQAGWFGNVNVNHRAAMPFTSDGQNVAKEFTLINAKLGYKRTIGKNWSVEISAGANNLLGTAYYLQVFVNQLDDAYIPGPKEAQAFGSFKLAYAF